MNQNDAEHYTCLERLGVTAVVVTACLTLAAIVLVVAITRYYI